MADLVLPPIFKGKPINYDPRERFIAALMEKRGDYNIFHALRWIR
jgi:hypothetical protein